MNGPNADSANAFGFHLFFCPLLLMSSQAVVILMKKNVIIFLHGYLFNSLTI